MELREAEPGDERLLAEEFWLPLAEQMEQYSELNELTDDAVETAVDGFRDLLEADEQFVFLLEVDGTEVAYLSCAVDDRPTRRRGKHVSIADVYVREGYRGQGCGTRLLERAEALAAEEGCDFVDVSAEWGNEPARRFYEDRGYEPKQVSYVTLLE